MLSSRGEKKIHEILEKNEVIFEEEYEFKELKTPQGKPLRFDFAVFDDDYNLIFLIEFQGRQHYEPVARYGGLKGFYHQRYNDNRKRRFCAFNNIKLVEISYQEESLLSYDFIMNRADLF